MRKRMTSWRKTSLRSVRRSCSTMLLTSVMALLTVSRRPRSPRRELLTLAATARASAAAVVATTPPVEAVDYRDDRDRRDRYDDRRDRPDRPRGDHKDRGDRGGNRGNYKAGQKPGGDRGRPYKGQDQAHHLADDGSFSRGSRSPSRSSSRDSRNSRDSRSPSRSSKHSIADEEEAYAMSAGRSPRAQQEAPVENLTYDDEVRSRHKEYYNSRRWKSLFQKKKKADSEPRR